MTYESKERLGRVCLLRHLVYRWQVSFCHHRVTPHCLQGVGRNFTEVILHHSQKYHLLSLLTHCPLPKLKSRSFRPSVLLTIISHRERHNSAPIPPAHVVMLRTKTVEKRSEQQQSLRAALSAFFFSPPHTLPISLHLPFYRPANTSFCSSFGRTNRKNLSVCIPRHCHDTVLRYAVTL
jgi:hypothetical protein